MLNKKITITDLAGMVQRGFKEVAKKVDVDQQFGEVNQRLANLKSDVSYPKSRVLEIGRTLNHHEELLEEHSAELKWIHKKIDEFTDPRSARRVITHKEYIELETRVATLEKKVSLKNH